MLFGRTLHVWLFLLGMGATAYGLHSVDRLPFWGWSRSKMAMATAPGFDCDTIFLGSSRMFRALRPELFDARMAELGQPCKSYNLALAGLRRHDVAWIGHWLASQRPAAVRRVVIELHSYDQFIRSGQWMTDQEIEMHPPCMLPDRLGSLWVSPRGWEQRANQVGYALVHTLANTLRLGQGPRILDDLLAEARGAIRPKVFVPRNRGWEEFGDVRLEHVLRDRKHFLYNPADHEAIVREMIARPIPKHLFGGFNADSLRAEAHAWRAIDIEPIFVIMPTVCRDFYGRDGVTGVTPELRILELDNPVANRALYDLELFFDASHYDVRGAEVFSRELATRLAALPDAPPLPPLPPRPLPVDNLQATAELDAATGTLRIAAKNLPFVGDVVAMIATERAELPLGDGKVLGVAANGRPCLLVRNSLYAASLEVPVTQLPKHRPLFVQVGTLVDGKPLSLSTVLEVPSDR